MLPQHRHFRHPCLICFYRFQQRITFFRNSICLFLQLCITLDSMLFHEHHSFCHLLQIKDFRPTRISRASALLHFGTDIYKERQLRLLMHLRRPCACAVFLGRFAFMNRISSNHFAEFFNRISFTKRAETSKSGVAFSPQCRLFSIFILVSYFLQNSNQFPEVFWFSCQCYINGLTDFIPLRFFLRIFRSLLPFSIGLPDNDRQPVFQADDITEPCQRKTGQTKISEFSGAV